MSSWYRLFLITIGSTDTKYTRPVRILQEFIFKPHLTRLRKRPYKSIVLEGGNGMGILASSKNREARLSRNLFEAFRQKEITKACNDFVVTLCISH
jgi:hypothetical protein